MTTRKKPAKKSTTKKTASKQQALHAPTCSGVYRLRGGGVAFIEANKDTEEAVIWPWKGRITENDDFQYDYTYRADDIWTCRGSYMNDCSSISNNDIVEFISVFPIPAPPLPNTQPLSTSSETLTGNMQVGGDHYKNMKHQPIDVMESCMIPEELQGFLRGNAMKYLMRMGSKGAALQDAQKAMHYIEMLVRSLQKQGETT